MDLVPPDEHELLVFWVSLAVLAGVARLLGGIARRFGQPAVVGELAAGVVLGPSVLGALAPGVSGALFPADRVQTAMLFTVGWIGVVLLLLAAGYETDFGLIRRLGRAAAIVALGSLLVPVVVGFGTGMVLPDQLLGDGTDRLVFALFVAAALSISSLPVIAKILAEMGLVRRTFGQLTLAVAMANDVAGWILLGVIAGAASTGRVQLGDLALTLAGAIVFFALAATVGQRAIDRLMRSARRRSESTATTSVVVLSVLVGGAATQWLGIEAVLGAFVVGVLLGRSEVRDDRAVARIQEITTVLFAPVFFATAGLRIDLGLLAEPETFLWAVVVLALASASKFVGAFGGARLAGLGRREGAALGVGLNARGALEVVIASVGLSMGALNQSSYTIVVLMAVATTVMAAPLLRLVVGGWHGTPEEVDRLAREESLRTNVAVRTGRALLAGRGGPGSIVAAQLLDLAWPPQSGVTVLSSAAGGRRPDVAALHDVLVDRPVDHLVTDTGDGPVDDLLREASGGYGVICIGARSPATGGGVVSPLIDELLVRSPVPVIVVRCPPTADGTLPWAFGRAVVPVSGTDTSRAAQELAANVSARLGTELVLSHVLARRADPVISSVGGTATLPAVDPPWRDPRLDVADTLLGEADALAARHGARTRTIVRTAPNTAAGINELARDCGADLVVLGANMRPLSGRPFLGHTVEELLAGCDATVVVVAIPPGWGSR
ncbi:MAG: cation:proton antiporter [Actinomycetota bacterium]|nr:cation:proton antiporter [Actinomycetota bacterium]